MTDDRRPGDGAAAPERLTVRVAGDRAGGPAAALAGEPLIVGREPGCDLELDDPKVSRRHARLERLPGGRVRITDLDTTNGTFVDEHRIAEPTVLSGGQTVRVGRTHLEIVPGDPPSPARAETEVADAVAGGPRTPPPRRRSVIQRTRSAIERRELSRAVRRATVLGAVAVALGVVAIVLLATGVFSGDAPELPPTAERIVEEVAPSTVLVIANVDGERRGNGTGWVLDAREGLIVTNAHVVNAGTDFEIGVGTDTRRATVVGDAPCEDLAVLRVEDTAGLKTLPIADQDSLRLGETVVAVGFPGTASEKDALTATTGVVSRTRATFDLRAPDVPQYGNVVQTDTAINPGNSGGPLVDLEARLVGVNSASGLPGTENQNYAIGADRVVEVTDRLRRGESIAWSGMSFEYADPAVLESEGFPAGIVVTAAVPGSSAAAAGIPFPAILTAVDGVPMDGTLPSYCDAIANVRDGASATFTVATGPGRLQDYELAVD